jgi:hypothetical protein
MGVWEYGSKANREMNKNIYKMINERGVGEKEFSDSHTPTLPY